MFFYLLLCMMSCSRTQSLYAVHHEKTPEEKYEEYIAPTEDLMREHGLLNRVLIIYEEIIHLIEKQGIFDHEVLTAAVDIIHDFVEQYHEKMEELYIFPIFEKHKKHTRLIKTLRTQHEAGRAITTQIKRLLARKKPLRQRDVQTIARLLRKFIRMYRAHESREDTVIFSNVRHYLPQKDFEALAEIFEDTEHELFGKEGFEGVLKKVVSLERQLGIDDLAIFTPQ